MKKLIFIICSMLITLASNAQTKQLWGMTSRGGSNNMGVIFQFDPATSIFTKKFDFDGVANGAMPYGSLIQASDGKLYGMTNQGGANDVGVLFQYDPTTSTFTKKLDFNTSNGANPWGSIIQASDGNLYGTTNYGGLNGAGVLFKYDPATSTYAKMVDFNDTNGDYPQCSLMQASNGKLYGITTYGGKNRDGSLFEYNLGSNTYSKMIDLFYLNGYGSYGSLVQASDGKLYGVTGGGAGYGYGVLFQYDPVSITYIKKIDFSNILGSNGYGPVGSLIQASDGELYGATPSGGPSGSSGVIFQYNPVSSTYTKKIDGFYNYGGYGIWPIGNLVQTSDGMFYGMTEDGPNSLSATIFQWDPYNANPYNAKLTFMLYFIGTNGKSPTTNNSLIEVTSTGISTDIKNNNTDNTKLFSGKSFIRAEFDGNANVEVYNLSGLLLKQTHATNTITIDNLNTGLYILKMNGTAYKVVVE